MIPLQRNPQHKDKFTIDGYTDIGWANGWAYELVPSEQYPKLQVAKFTEPKEYVAHQEAGHKTRGYSNSLYVMRGTDEITICDECKIFWHVDMSD